MIKNKKGVSGVITVIAICAVLITAAILYLAFMPKVVPQTIIQPGAPAAAPTTLLGKDSTLGWIVYDRANSNRGTVLSAVATYIINQKGEFVDDATASSTTRKSSSVTVGDVLSAAAFNATHYGVKKSGFVVDSQTAKLDLESLTAATGLNVKFWSNSTTGEQVAGETLGANQEKTISKMTIELNNSNEAFILGGIYIDTNSSSNLLGVSLNTPASVTRGSYDRGNLPSSNSVSVSKTTTNLLRTTNDDILFEFSEPIYMLSWDIVTVPGITFTSNGDPSELPNVCVYDKQMFRSNKVNDVLFGAETDAASPADVATGDLCYQFKIW